jgi:predicted nicotinamide N-methyase
LIIAIDRDGKEKTITLKEQVIF